MLNYATLQPQGTLEFKQTEVRSYDTLKKELDDATFAMTRVEELDIWYDDEFLLKGKYELTLIIKNKPEPRITDWDIVLCGSLMFASCDDKGDTVSLSENAKQILEKFVPASIGGKLVWVYNNYKI